MLDDFLPHSISSIYCLSGLYQRIVYKRHHPALLHPSSSASLASRIFHLSAASSSLHSSLRLFGAALAGLVISPTRRSACLAWYTLAAPWFIQCPSRHHHQYSCRDDLCAFCTLPCHVTSILLIIYIVFCRFQALHSRCITYRPYRTSKPTYNCAISPLDIPCISSLGSHVFFLADEVFGHCIFFPCLFMPFLHAFLASLFVFYSTFAREKIMLGLCVVVLYFTRVPPSSSLYP